MNRRFWAIAVKRALVTTGLVFVLGSIFNRVFADEYASSGSWLTTGAWSVLLYWLAASAVGVVHAASGLIYLKFFSTEDFTASVVEDFHRVKLLPPGPYDVRNFDYLAALADDEGQEPNQRVRAALLHASYTAHMGQGLFKPLIMRRAIDAGVRRYSEEAPHRD